MMIPFLFLPILAFADAPVAEVPVGDLISLMMKVIGDYKALGWQAGMSAIVMLLIASMKNSMLRKFIWDKMKWGKVFVAPGLSLILVIIGQLKGGHAIDMKSLMLAMITGAGALALHEILDGLKYIPGIGPMWVSLIDLVGNLLKKPDPKV